MSQHRNQAIAGVTLLWCLLIAALATLSSEQIVSQRLESAAREALEVDASLSQLEPHFRGLTGWFSGSITEPGQLQAAYSLASAALPAGRFIPQSAEDLLQVTSPEEPEETAPIPEPVALLAAKPPEVQPETEPAIPPPTPARSDPEPSVALAPASLETETPPAQPALQPMVESEPTEEDSPAPPNPLTVADSEMMEPHREVDQWAMTIVFENDSSLLSDSQFQGLEPFLSNCSQKTDHRLRLVSYVDPRGDRDYNAWLGNRRADRVGRQLARLGVELPFETVIEFESPSSPGPPSPGVERRVEVRFVR